MIRNAYCSLRAFKGVSQEVLDYIQSLEVEFKEGRKDFSNGVYLNAEKYISKPREIREFEGHKKYVDIQLILKGKETIWVVKVGTPGLEITNPYNPERDILFLNGTVAAQPLRLQAGNVAVLFEEDLHMPCTYYDDNSTEGDEVYKVVVKIPVEIFYT